MELLNIIIHRTQKVEEDNKPDIKQTDIFIAQFTDLQHEFVGFDVVGFEYIKSLDMIIFIINDDAYD